jgi:VWFA-related protein
MLRRGVAVGLVLLLVGLAPAALAAPLTQAPPTVRLAQVDTTAYPRVTLYVNVVDAAGRTVEGLSAADFRVVEEGQEVAIADFAGLGQQRPVDIVFVLDTTGSMSWSIEGVKETCVNFAQTLARRERDYRLALVTFGDDVRESHPFTDNVAQFQAWMEPQRADGGGADPENPLGALQHAAAFSFRSGAQHLIILITDAPAHVFGDSPDEDTTFSDPRLTVAATLARLQAASISVHAVAPDLPEFRELAEKTGGQLYLDYTDFTDLLNRLGAAIANQYRFTYYSPRPAFDGSRREVAVTVQGVSGSGFYFTPTEPLPGGSTSEFYNALRTPLQISTDPRVIGTNAFLAILLALLFGLTSTLLNDTLNANRDAFEKSFLGRIGAAFKKAGRVLARPLGISGRGQRIGSMVQVAFFLIITALIASFLDPSFPSFSWASVGIFFSMLFSVALVNLAYEGSQVLASRRFRLEAALKLNPGGILVAIGCVLFSRLVGFLPGYLYGVSGGYVLGSAVELGRRREAAIGGTALGVTSLLALLAWIFTVPTALLLGALGAGNLLGGAVGALQGFLLTIFFVGLEMVFLELFPLGSTNGAVLFRWSKVVWGLAFGVVAFVAAHTLLTPDSAYLDTVRSHSLQLLLGVLALYSLLAVGVWYFFEVRKSAAEVHSCSACGHENKPEARFCVSCGTALPPPGRRAVSRQGLALVIVLGIFWMAIVVAVILAAVGVA